MWWENPSSKLKTAKWYQMVPLSAPHSYHTEQFNPCPTLPGSHVVIYSQLHAGLLVQERWSNLKTPRHV